MKKKEFGLLMMFSLITLIIVHYVNQNNSLNNSSYDILASESSVNEKKDVDPKTIVTSLQEEYKNKDIIAQLQISNTSFKTPIPQSTNNEYYYRRLPNKSPSIIGSTYLDYRTKLDESRVLIIYGHNSSKYDMPFKVLENYYNEDYYNDHKYIELITSIGIKRYEVFSVYVETGDYSYYTDINFEDDNAFLKHITKLKNKSFYDTGVELNQDDNILILQACSTHKKYTKYKHKFVLIISREVMINENDEEND